MTAPTITDTDTDTALAVALNDYARLADDEARKARQARDTEIRRLYAAGVLPHELAAALDGVSVRRIHQIKGE